MVELPLFYTSCPKCKTWLEFVIKPSMANQFNIVEIEEDSTDIGELRKDITTSGIKRS